MTELGVAKDRTCYGPMGVATPDNSLTGVNRNGKEAAGNMWTQDMGTGIRMRASMGQRKRSEICCRISLIAIHVPRELDWRHEVPRELDWRQWDTLVFKGEQEENKDRWTCK